MSNPHEFSAAAVYALLALRQPRSLAELSVAARTRAFPAAAPTVTTPGFAAFTSQASARTHSADGASALRRSVSDPFLVRLSAPELRSSDAA